MRTQSPYHSSREVPTNIYIRPNQVTHSHTVTDSGSINVMTFVSKFDLDGAHDHQEHSPGVREHPDTPGTAPCPQNLETWPLSPCSPAPARAHWFKAPSRVFPRAREQQAIQQTRADAPVHARLAASLRNHLLRRSRAHGVLLHVALLLKALDRTPEVSPAPDAHAPAGQPGRAPCLSALCFLSLCPVLTTPLPCALCLLCLSALCSLSLFNTCAHYIPLCPVLSASLPFAHCLSALCSLSLFPVLTALCPVLPECLSSLCSLPLCSVLSALCPVLSVSLPYAHCLSALSSAPCLSYICSLPLCPMLLVLTASLKLIKIHEIYLNLLKFTEI